MGAVPISPNLQQQLQLNNWIQAIEDPSAIFSKVNPYRKRLLINKINSELIQQYELQFMSQQDFKMFVSQIELRKQINNKIQMKSLEENAMFKNSPYIYRIKYFVNSSIEELCSTAYHGLLYINKVELRLKQINDIPFEDVTYLFKCCFQGFKVLYEHYGSFTITQEMIFFDKKGQVKLWINPNLSKNYPNYLKIHEHQENTITIQVKDTQHEMIRQIISLIDQNTDEIDQAQIHFNQYLQKKISHNTMLTFQKVIELFHRYIQDYNLNIGTYMRSIYQLYHEENDHVDINYTNSNRIQIQKTQHKPMRNGKSENGLEPINFNSNSRAYIQNKPIVMPKFPHKSYLEQSVVSKRSYNSQLNKRIINNHPKVNQLTVNRQNNNFYLSQNSSQVSNYQKAQHPIIYPVIKHQSINRNIITFCPPEGRALHNSALKPQIAKYKSLEKYPPIIPLNESKSITFSYQSKNTIPQSNNLNLPTNNPAKFSFQVKMPKKQSFIQRLNFNAQAANTVKIINPHNNPLPQNIDNNLNELKETKKINYFSTSQSYILDKQIAQDMQKYLGINPNLI